MKIPDPNLWEAISEELEIRLKDRLAHSHISKLFSFQIESIKRDYCVLSLEYRDEITNGIKSKGTIHGGIVASLADTAAAFALSTNFDGQMSFATVDLHVNFLARAQSKIYAHARVIRKGSRVNVCDVDVRDDMEKLVAKASLNFILTKRAEVK